MMNLLWIAVLALQGQETDDAPSVTIPKAERSTYLPVLEKYKSAEALLASDPLECELRCTDLISQVKDAYREKRIRIQNTDGSYGDWTLFLPYQLRGRANLARADALAARDRVQAAALARKAAEDLELSSHRQVKSSGALLERARALAKLPEDPRTAEARARFEEVVALRNTAAPEAFLRRCVDVGKVLDASEHKDAFRLLRASALEECCKAHVDQGRFRSARDFLAVHGGFLSEPDRAKLARGIEESCRNSVAGAVGRFQSGLRPIQTWAGLRAAKFEPLPEPGELVGESSELEECRRVRERLLRVSSVADPLAIPLPEFLKMLSEVEAQPGLAADLSRMRLERAVAGAADLPGEELRVRREEVDRIVASVRGGGLETYRSRLPEDPPTLDGLGKELLEGAWGAAAAELEGKLGKFEAGRLSRDSRRKLGTYLLVAAATRLFLAGESGEGIAERAELRETGRRLHLDGGPFAGILERVSPKIGELARRLSAP
jgi:hypothetical protein